jgi:adenosine kinase
MTQPGALFTIGNPLLDISTTVDEAFLAKYNLKANDAILAEEAHMPIYAEIEAGEVDYVAGGATQNSARVAQALLGVPNAVTYTGCIGDDAAGKVLSDCAVGGGVKAPYLKDAETPTGKCAVLLTAGGAARCLVTSLGAANNFKHAHAETEEVTALINAAQVYYTAGFFQTVSPETVIHIGKHAAENNKTFTTNLSAPFLMQVPPFFEAIKNTIPYTDVLFGNESEAATWAECMGWEEKSVADIAVKLAAMPKENTAKPRTVVFTQGAEPTIIATAEGFTEYPIIPCDNLVDTNGAGDAFVGGYLAKLVEGQDVAECVRAGNYAANVIIQRSGCTFPEEGFAVPAKE